MTGGLLYIYTYTYTYIYIHTLHYNTIQYNTLHYITLHIQIYTDIYIERERFPKMELPLNHPFLVWMSNYKPSSYGGTVSPFMEIPICSWCCHSNERSTARWDYHVSCNKLNLGPHRKKKGMSWVKPRHPKPRCSQHIYSPVSSNLAG
jgi:hypothetical protein